MIGLSLRYCNKNNYCVSAVQEERGPRKNKGRRRNSSAKLTRIIKKTPDEGVQMTGKERHSAVNARPNFITSYSEGQGLEFTLFSCYKLQSSWNMDSHKSAFRKPHQASNREISFVENTTKEGRTKAMRIIMGSSGGSRGKLEETSAPPNNQI